MRKRKCVWVIEDKFDRVRTERKKGQGIVAISQNSKTGALAGIDDVYYQNAYPFSAVVYGHYTLSQIQTLPACPL